MEFLEIIYLGGSWALITLTILAYLAVLYRFFRYKHNHYGLQMILLPNIAIFVYGIIDTFRPNTSWENSFKSQLIKTACSHFAMYSAVAFAIYNVMVLSAIRSANFTQNFIRINLAVCLVISVGFGVV